MSNESAATRVLRQAVEQAEERLIETQDEISKYQIGMAAVNARKVQIQIEIKELAAALRRSEALDAK